MAEDRCPPRRTRLGSALSFAAGLSLLAACSGPLVDVPPTAETRPAIAPTARVPMFGAYTYGGQGYDRIATLGPQPIWFAEVASAEAGGDKPAWVRDMFATASSAFPRLEALIWFDEHKEADWRITSRREVASALREALAARSSAPILAPAPPDRLIVLD